MKVLTAGCFWLRRTVLTTTLILKIILLVNSLTGEIGYLMGILKDDSMMPSMVLVDCWTYKVTSN